MYTSKLLNRLIYLCRVNGTFHADFYIPHPFRTINKVNSALYLHIKVSFSLVKVGYENSNLSKRVLRMCTNVDEITVTWSRH